MSSRSPAAARHNISSRANTPLVVNARTRPATVAMFTSCYPLRPIKRYGYMLLSLKRTTSAIVVRRDEDAHKSLVRDRSYRNNSIILLVHYNAEIAVTCSCSTLRTYYYNNIYTHALLSSFSVMLILGAGLFRGYRRRAV